MTGKPRLRVIAGALAAVLLVLGCFLLIVELCAFDPGFYEQEYSKNNTADYVGVSGEVLGEATTVLIDYLQDRRSDLDLEFSAPDGVREYYNEREKLHMEDVKVLNLGAVAFMWTALAAGSVLALLALLPRDGRWRVMRAFFFAVLGVLAAFFIIGIAAAVDFTSFWTGFHHVFFRNDLWTFDPRTSLLIRMFEEQFFFDLVARILVWFLSVCFALLLLTGVCWRKGRRREVAHAHTRH